MAESSHVEASRRGVPKRKRRVALVLALALALVGAAGIVFLIAWDLRWPVRAFNVSREDCPFDLPAGSTNVSYFRPRLGPVVMYEFDISREEFLAWARSKKLAPTLIGNRPRSIPRCVRSAPGRYEESTKTIVRGYYCEKMSGPDSGLHLGYDLDSGRAYWYSHSR